MNVDIDIEADQERLRPAQSEVERLWADNSKAKSLLSWEPLYAGREGLKKGLAENAECFINKKNLKKYKIHLYNL